MPGRRPPLILGKRVEIPIAAHGKLARVKILSQVAIGDKVVLEDGISLVLRTSQIEFPQRQHPITERLYAGVVRSRLQAKVIVSMIAGRAVNEQPRPVEPGLGQ